MLIDFVSEVHFDNKHPTLRNAAKVSLLLFYFFESVPAIVLILILSQKIKYYSETKEHMSKSIALTESDKAEKMNTFETGTMYKKNDRDSFESDSSLSDEENFADESRRQEGS